MTRDTPTAQDVRIEPAAAAVLVHAGDAIVVDVVSPADWQRMAEAIHSAIRIPPQEFGQRWQELPRERTIIAYCT